MNDLSLSMQAHMDVVYFVYGLAFFALGMVILVQPRGDSRYELSRYIWLLAVFGLVHGLQEWLDLWKVVRGDSSTLALLRIVFLLVSYGFLFEFGRRLTLSFCDRTPAVPRWVARLLGWPIYGFVALGFLFEFMTIPDGMLAMTVASRYFLGFVGSILAGTGFLLCIPGKFPQPAEKSALLWAVKYFVLAAVAFILYGLSGLVVPFANVIHEQWFLATFRFPVQIFRAVCAILAVIAIGNILRIFHREGREKLQSALTQARESAAKLQEINLVMADGVYALDSHGRVTFFNPEAERLLGWTAAELLGRNGHDFFHYKTPDGVPISAEECPVHGYIQSGQIYRSINDWLVRKDGSIIPVAIVSSPIIHDGTVVGSVAAFHDITLRQEMERALRASEQRFRDTLENAPIGMVVAEPGGKFVQVNQALCKILGYEREELLNLSFNEITHPDDREITHANVEKALHGNGDTYRMEKRYIRKGGRDVWVQLSVSIQSDATGTPQYFIGQIEDITGSKLAQQALWESEEKFRLISASANDAIIIIGAMEEVTYWNPAAETIFGYQMDEVLGKGMHELITPHRHRDAAHHGFERFRSTGEGPVIGKTLELLALRKNGEEFPIEMSISAFRIKGQWQAMGILRDVSSRKRLEGELQHLNQTLAQQVRDAVARNMEQERIMIHQSRLAAMGEMIGNIAHQWRQPINALNLVLANIKDAYEYNELDKAYLDKSVKSGEQLIQKMSATIDDFRNFFKPNKVKESFRPCDGIEDAIKLVSHSFKSYNIDIELENIGESGPVMGYPNEFAQVVLNALSNAREAIVEKKIRGKVAIRIDTGKDVSTISIRDNGSGIADAVLPKVFDPYFTTKEKGTGIGLYMSKMIMDHMDGDIAIHNVEDGAEVLITLPLARESVA